jgi:hypothetical protein
MVPAGRLLLDEDQEKCPRGTSHIQETQQRVSAVFRCQYGNYSLPAPYDLSEFLSSQQSPLLLPTGLLASAASSTACGSERAYWSLGCHEYVAIAGIFCKEQPFCAPSRHLIRHFQFVPPLGWKACCSSVIGTYNVLGYQ